MTEILEQLTGKKFDLVHMWYIKRMLRYGISELPLCIYDNTCMYVLFVSVDNSNKRSREGKTIVIINNNEQVFSTLHEAWEYYYQTLISKNK